MANETEEPVRELQKHEMDLVAGGAPDMFLQIDGIKGEAADDNLGGLALIALMLGW